MQNAFEIKFFRKGLLKCFSLENSEHIRVNRTTKTIMLEFEKFVAWTLTCYFCL